MLYGLDEINPPHTSTANISGVKQKLKNRKNFNRDNQQEKNQH
jgi:hypothetical protein